LLYGVAGIRDKKVWGVYSLYYYGAYTFPFLPSPLEGMFGVVSP
jgi:hypothetical protein